MSRRYGEDVDEAADRLYDEHRQQMADAYADGVRVGCMGLGAGLCPQGYSNDERDEWLRGFASGAASLLSERKKAA
jgi:ribosome modulation factor